MKRWAAAAMLAMATIIALADSGRLGFLRYLYDFPFGDKVGHFSLFGLLSLSVNLAALRAYPSGRKTSVAIGASVILGALAGAEEFSQRWFPSRHSSALDLTASILGICCFAWLALIIYRRRLAEEPPRAQGQG